MAIDNGSLGISFAPTNDQQKQQAVGSPLQQAIQILRLTLPKFAGARTPVGDPNLLGSGQGGGPGLGNSVVQSILAQILGRNQGGMSQTAGAAQNPLAAAVQSRSGSVPTPQFNFPVGQTPQTGPNGQPPFAPAPQSPAPSYEPAPQPRPQAPPTPSSPVAHPNTPTGGSPIPGRAGQMSPDMLDMIFGRGPQA